MEGDPLQQRPTLVDRLADRWQRDPGFRNAMSVLGIALALMAVCGTTLVADNFLTQFVGGLGGSAAKYHVNIGNDASIPTYPVATPAADAAQNPSQTNSGSPVATVTFSPSPTATVTPAIPVTPTPVPQPTLGPGQTFTVSGNPSPLWKAGKTGTISNIATTPPQRNVQMVILLQFGTDTTCTATLTVQLGNNGADHNTENVNIPTCFTTQVTVQATYTIAGQSPVIDPNFTMAQP